MVRNPQAICIQCGHFKARPFVRCGNCLFTPVTAEDSARSLILSRPFEVKEQLKGLTPPELRAAAAQIRSGQGYVFDPAMLARFIAQQEKSNAVKARRQLIDRLRWACLSLAVLATVLWLALRD